MTIAKLVVEIEARNRALRSTLSDSTRMLNSFAREVERGMKAISASPDLGPGQRAFIEGFGRDIVAQAKVAERSLRDLLKSGAISKEEFSKRGQEAIGGLITGVRERLNSPDFRNILSGSRGNFVDPVVNTFEKAGEKSMAAFNKGARNVRAADVFLSELTQHTNAALAKVDQQVSTGQLSASERNVARAQILANRNDALIRQIQQMTERGQMRPALREAMLGQLDPRGFGLGLSQTAAERVFRDTERQVGALKERLQTSIARTKLDLAGGLDPREGERRIAAAFEAMNQGVLHGRERLRAASRLTPELEKLLGGSLVKVPVVAPDLTRAQRLFQDTERQVGRLRERLQTDVARTKLDLLAGLDQREGERRIAAAYEGFNRSIGHGRERIRQAEGQVPAEIERLLAASIARVPKVRPPELLDERAIRVATANVGRLRERLDTSLATARLDLAQKLIRPEEFERRAQEALARFERGIQHGRSRLRADQLATPGTEQLLARELQSAQAVVARSVRAIESQGVVAARGFISQFLNTYNSRIGEARAAFERGDISRGAYKRAGVAAGQEFNRAVAGARADLKAQNLLDPQTERLILSAYKNLGTGAINAFSAAMNDPSVVGKLQVARALTHAGTVLSVALTAPLAAAAGESVKLAGDFEQAGKRLEIAFGPASVQLERTLNGLRKDIPATSSELRQMAARLGELIIPLGLSTDQVAQMSTELIKVTKNISLFSGVSTERAFGAVINGMVGQSRELRRLGVNVTDAAIRDRAYRDGLARVGAQLSSTQKIMASYRVIVERTRLIQNTLAESQGTFNVRMLFFTARLKEAGITIGTTLLPFVTRLIVGLTDLLDRFNALSDTQRRWIIGLGTVAAVLGPILIAVGTLTRALALYRATLLAMEALGGGAAAGAAGGGGLFVALGLSGFVARAIPVVGAILALKGAVDLYKAATSDAGEETSNFLQEISGQSKSSLQAMQVTFSQLAEFINKKQQDMLRTGKVKTLEPMGGGGLFGGTAEPLTIGAKADVEEFNRLNEELTRATKSQQAIKKEMDSITDAERRMDAAAGAFNEKLKKTQADAQMELLTEELQKLKLQFSDLALRATAARSAIQKSVRTHDTRGLEQSIERSKEVISSLATLSNQFRDLSLVPENAPLKRELENLSLRAQAARDNLESIVTTAEKDRSLQTFAARLEEIRKSLALGMTTGNLGLVSAAFEQMQSLQQEIGQKLADATAGLDDETKSRLRSMSLTIDQLRQKFNDFLPKEFFRRIDETIEQLRLLKDEAGGENVITSTGVPLDDWEEADRLVRRLVSDNLELSSEIVYQNSLGKTATEHLREQRKLIQQINASTPNVFEKMFGREFLPKIQTVAAALKGAQAREENANLFGDPDAARAAHLDVVRAQADLGKLRAALIAVMTANGVSSEVQQQVLEGFAEAYKKAGGAAADFSEKVDRGSRRLQRLGALVALVRQISDAFGLAGTNIEDALQGAAQLVESFQRLKEVRDAFEKRRATEAAKRGVDPSSIGMNATETIAQVSAVIGAAVAAFKTVSAIVRFFTGKSETEIEHDRILQENNQRLAELNLSVQGFTGSIGQQERARQLLRLEPVRGAIAAGAFTDFFGSFGRIGTEQINVINARLKEFGLSWEEVTRIAKDNGIQILDSKGRIVAGAFDQLDKAIALAREHFFDFADTLSEQQSKLDLFNNVFNVPDTGQQVIQDQVALLAKLAPSLFKQFFTGVDLSDAKAVEAALQALTQAFLNGSLEADESLKLLDKGELIQIITGVAGGLDKLREATDSLTESMLNVPDWFKTNQVRFLSADVAIPSATGAPPVPFTPTIPAPPLGPGQGGGTSIDTNVEQVDINIYQRPGEDADALAERAIAKLRQRRFMRTGSTRLPGIDD